MGQVLFSPSGRLGSETFMRAAIILIAVNFILGLPDILGMSSTISMVAGLVSVVTFYCWVVIWIKRYHDAGKTGVYCLLPIAVFLLVIMTVMLFMLWPYIMEMVEATNVGAGPSAAEEMEQRMQSEKGWVILIVSAVISFAVAFLFNKTIKHEPNENQYGPA